MNNSQEETVTDSKVIDFDAFRSEQTGKPVELVVGGVTYYLPPDLPATVAVDVIRMQRDQGTDGDVSAETLLSLGEGLFGDQFDTIIREHRLSTKEMGTLIKETLAAYNAATEPDPNRETRRAQAKTTRSGS